MSNRLRILSVMSELGAGTRGSSLGFEALRLASVDYDKSFFKRYPVVQVPTENERLFSDSTKIFAKRLDGIEKMYRNIKKNVSGSIREGMFPVVISGDHSNAGGTIAGIREAYPHQRLGVIWIDAHGDLHSPYTSPSGNVHGMPLATALHEDNLEYRNNEPLPETVVCWNRMKGDTPRVRHSDLIFIGVRDTEKPEEELMKRHHIPNITTQELRRTGTKETALKALEYLKECDIIYISFDVDSMDPSVSVGTGTPVAGGLMEEEARELILHLIEDKRLCCLEMTEINPLLDKNENSMAKAAFRIFKPVLEKLEHSLNLDYTWMN